MNYLQASGVWWDWTSMHISWGFTGNVFQFCLIITMCFEELFNLLQPITIVETMSKNMGCETEKIPRYSFQTFTDIDIQGWGEGSTMKWEHVEKIL